MPEMPAETSTMVRSLWVEERHQPLRSVGGNHMEGWGKQTPASPTFCIAVMAAGRAFPVAKQTVTPSFSAAFRASTDEGKTWLALSNSVPSMSSASSLILLLPFLLDRPCISWTSKRVGEHLRTVATI